MLLDLLAKVPPLRWLLVRLATWRVQEKSAEILPYLGSSDRILDVGAGNCVLCQVLGQAGYSIVPLDLANHSFVDELVPVVYDGLDFPFRDASFDVAMVITVLHHTKDPDAILAECRRVSERIVVIEEIYETDFEKYVTYFVDSVFNLEFLNHPRSNRTDAEWRATFKSLGLHVETARYSRSLGVLRRVTYHLERSAALNNVVA